MNRTRFPRFVWGVLIYNLIVILWGALVRATISGDGCSNHWPLCGGSATLQPSATLIGLTHRQIEFTHRLTSGVSLLLSVLLFVWAMRIYDRQHPAWKGALLCMLFTFSEAAVGAGLVRFKLVAQNASVYRAVAISAHLTNTFLLLLALTLTGWWSSGGGALRLRRDGAVVLAVATAIFAAILLGVSGAITATGDTLFPSASLAAGIRADFSSTASFWLRLRVFHPFLATAIGIYLLALAAALNRMRPSARMTRYAKGIAVLFALEMVAGVVNLLLRAPLALQLVHLLLADMLWVNIVLLSAAALSTRTSERGSAPLKAAKPQAG